MNNTLIINIKINYLKYYYTLDVIQFKRVIFNNFTEAKIQVFVSIVIPELTLFEMAVKLVLMDAPELGQSDLAQTPKVLYPIDVITPLFGKFIPGMTDPKMTLIPVIHQPVIRLKPIRIKH
jgi:hypothetical protein